MLYVKLWSYLTLWRYLDCSACTTAFLPHDSDLSAEQKPKTAAEIRADCLEFEVIPDLFRHSPKKPLQVRFLFELVPEFGNALDPKDLIYRPYYVVWPFNRTEHYTLMLLDIDYPSRENPKMRSWNHWLVVNIPGPDWIDRGEVWAEYLGPKPSFGSGFHRYVFLVYKQPGYVHFDEYRYPKVRLDEHRASFSIAKFRKKYNLKPVAINFFQAQWLSNFSDPVS